MLVVVLALIVDLFVPWLDQEGLRWSPGQAGLFTILLIAILAAALAPLANASLRSRPGAAVIPLVVGAAAVGATVLLWFTVRAGATASEHTIIPGDVFGTRTTPATLVTTPASVDLGLYLFLVGSCVLAYCGYRLFLATTRAQVGAPPQRAVTVTSPARSERRVLPFDTSESAGGLYTQSRTPAAVPAARAGSAPAIPLRASTSLSEVGSTASTSASGLIENSKSSIATPGTAEWNTASPPPERLLNLPPGAWRRQPGVHR